MTTKPMVIDSFRDEHFFLSNFAPSRISLTFKHLGNAVFIMPTGEHGFHAGKVAASDWSDKEKLDWLGKLSQAKTPNASKYMGRAISINVTNWNAMSYAVMNRVETLKFQQNPDLAKLLLVTGNATLIEGNTHGDMLWGTVNGVGKNQLGKILMAVRDDLRHTS